MLRLSVLFSPVTIKHHKTSGVQTGCSAANLTDQSTQCGGTKGSFLRNENFTNYENLLQNLRRDKDFILSWLKELNLHYLKRH